ncbi:MAG: Na+-dependent transporter [Candidatus Fermentimicrarchaeum limneticum]|uniref:Na+-dependent transporter n=1 Tax=Fermentimicrarchaeum limneticum TaxID=2795018 RepID=A0A7D6BH95_FERL1|nr:MAG: Na+-dependent transporter [Candidatus Fermentimicrarchaeum limneticum]
MPMSKYLFSLVIVISILFGLLLPGVSVLWRDYLNFLLALLMFFSALRVKKDEFKKVDSKGLLVLLLFVFVLMPLLSLPFRRLNSTTFLGVLFAFSSPSAAATAFFTSFLGGDIALGVIISFISSLLSLVTIPLTIQALAGAVAQVDNNKIFSILVEVIVVPILIALLTKKFFKRAVDEINRRRDYQLVVMFLLGAGIIGISHDAIVGNEYQLLGLTAAILILLLFGGGLAYLFGRRYGEETAITFFVATSIKNALLSFAIVLKLFGTAAALPMAANLIAQLILMTLLEVFGSRVTALSRSSAGIR